jgi:hypothetical protein
MKEEKKERGKTFCFINLICLEMKAANFSEKFITFHQSARRYIP